MKADIKRKFNLDQADIDNYTEWQLMKGLQYDRIWDAGKIKWQMTI